MKRIFLLSSILFVLSSCMTTRLERQQQRKKAKCERLGCNQSNSDSMMIIRETVTIREDTTIYIHVPGKVVHDTLIQVTQDPVTGLINSKNQFSMFHLQPHMPGLKMENLSMNMFRRIH